MLSSTHGTAAMVTEFEWQGAIAPHLDAPTVTSVAHVTVGCYGGRTSSGAYKNEDAAFVLVDPASSSTFCALFDAHAGTDSASRCIDMLRAMHEDISAALQADATVAFTRLGAAILEAFTSTSAERAFSELDGETAMLLCAQKDQFLWWLSVGDNQIYLFHPELVRLGQFALNQRQFFEWVGRANSLGLSPACYTRGTRELRSGRNQLLLITDGVLEYDGSPFGDPAVLNDVFARHAGSGQNGHERAHHEILDSVHCAGGRDSATLISFAVDTGAHVALSPSG
jgi:hypothetical protein